MKPESKKIDIFISKVTKKVDAIKLIRKYSSKSNADVLRSLDQNMPVYSGELRPEQFYQGIKTIINLLADFEKQSIGYDVYINNRKSSREDLFSINETVSNVSLSDIR